MFEVRKAKRQRRPLKISLEGLSGSGKTFTALRLAFALKRAGIGKKIVVADSENESAGLYDGVAMDGEKWEFDTCAIPHEAQNPAGYTACYEHLVGAGFDLVIIDSLSHAWHGAMEKVDAYAQRNKGDKFGGWAQITPEQRKMLTTLTDGRAHCIVTMRVKSEYERIEDNGRTKIKKVGMKTDQRENTEYEFDAVVRMEVENHAVRVEKVRGCTAMDGKTGDHIGPTFWKPLIDWWLSAPEAVSIGAELFTAIDTALDSATLQTAFGKLFKAHESKQITDAEYQRGLARKDELKAWFAAIDAGRAALKACADMPALATYWQSLEGQTALQKALNPDKERRKGELQAAQKQPA